MAESRPPDWHTYGRVSTTRLTPSFQTSSCRRTTRLMLLSALGPRDPSAGNFAIRRWWRVI
jgi:hypothetical protein